MSFPITGKTLAASWPLSHFHADQPVNENNEFLSCFLPQSRGLPTMRRKKKWCPVGAINSEADRSLGFLSATSVVGFYGKLKVIKGKILQVVASPMGCPRDWTRKVLRTPPVSYHEESMLDFHPWMFQLFLNWKRTPRGTLSDVTPATCKGRPKPFPAGVRTPLRVRKRQDARGQRSKWLPDLILENSIFPAVLLYVYFRSRQMLLEPFRLSSSLNLGFVFPNRRRFRKNRISEPRKQICFF